MHTLRHSWTTHLLEAGVSLPLIQAWLGHSSRATTSIYFHLTVKTKQQGLEKLTELLADLP